MLNHIDIMGRLTRDPELRYTTNNIPVASFTVAVDRDFSGKDSGEKQTDFINCIAWRSTGEFVSKYFSKGSMIVVSGHLQVRQYTDKDGKNRNVTEVVADNVYFGESKRDNAISSGTYGGSYQQNNSYSPQSSGYGAQTAPAQQTSYHQGTFQELDDSDGDLPF